MSLFDATTSGEVRRIRTSHRNEAHGGDQGGFYDCAACGAIDSRLARYERLEQSTVELELEQ